ncbi:Gfo/Idh/MocA family protein [Paracoccus sp. (in: a-proteobacteria)]|uniref:Gfo/Idh/MocA family protein n=1 Tax=Paracoccus sp. TaxID=267 RepID=UPI003A8AE313
MRVGIIGCGNISDIYATNGPLFRDIDFVACADVIPAAADRLAGKFGLRQMTVGALLAADDIDAVLNLTIPGVHAEVSMAAIANGKHVYSEKPLTTNLNDGAAIVRAAAAAGLRVGAAPDTVLGAGIQRARQALDVGEVGQILTGTAAIMSKGMEHWHPNPAFFYQPGGGPVLDLGPYYITTLITLLGPVQSVRATGQISPVARRFGAEGPNKGKTFPVDTFTTVNAVLSFVSGANISFIASWDVWRHGMLPFELHGTGASLRVPDPDTFGGAVEISSNEPQLNMHDPEQAALKGQRVDWRVIPTQDLVFGSINYPFGNPVTANYRGLGLAEMARAIVEDRPHRASGELALHVLAVMLGILEAAETDGIVAISHGCAAPAALTEGEAAGLLRAKAAG